MFTDILGPGLPSFSILLAASITFFGKIRLSRCPVVCTMELCLCPFVICESDSHSNVPISPSIEAMPREDNG